MVEPKILAKWLAEFPKKSTKKSYLAGVRRFLSCTYGDVFQLSKSEELAQKYIEECERARLIDSNVNNKLLKLIMQTICHVSWSFRT